MTEESPLLPTADPVVPPSCCSRCVTTIPDDMEWELIVFCVGMLLNLVYPYPTELDLLPFAVLMYLWILYMPLRLCLPTWLAKIYVSLLHFLFFIFILL